METLIPLLIVAIVVLVLAQACIEDALAREGAGGEDTGKDAD